VIVSRVSVLIFLREIKLSLPDPEPRPEPRIDQVFELLHHANHLLPFRVDLVLNLKVLDESTSNAEYSLYHAEFYKTTVRNFLKFLMRFHSIDSEDSESKN
jgi:hypothetical protein